MGCGPSKLKGDVPDSLGTEPAKPVRKVQSNFADVDYTHGSDKKKSIAGDMAPDETQPPVPPPGKAAAAEQKMNNDEQIKLEPYRTIEEPADTVKDPIGGLGGETADMIR